MATRREMLVGAGAGGLVAAAGMAGLTAQPPRTPVVLGHRGASALRPEHTLASYAKAIEDGADYIEPDLVISKDGALIIRHENNIAATTDIARHPEFADRKTEKLIDGQKQIGWFVEDFTLPELKTLRAIERLPQLRAENAKLDGQFDLVTWPEMVDFAAAEALARGRPIGLVPELKHSTYFRSIGMPLEDRFLASVAQHDYLRRCPLIVQSFEVANLKYLRAKLGRAERLKLMQLTTDPRYPPADIAKAGGTLSYGAMTAPAGLAEVAEYADILSPELRAIIPLGPDKRLGSPSPIVADAHRAGLLVMPYTFRPENAFLAADFRDGAGDSARNPEGSVMEIRRYLAAGIDGFFTDDPGLGRRAVAGRG
jgi:glycerophosphoryl diester phosphodiesterase